MKLMRLGAPGAERPAVRTDDGRVWDLTPVAGEIDGAFLASGGLDRARAAVGERRLAELDPRGLRVGAPVARPGKVVCIGLNYRDHAQETGAPVPPRPVVFMKDPGTVVGPYDEVLIPRGSARTDWEVELAVVIGSRARYLESAAERACGTSPDTPSATTSPSGGSSSTTHPSGTSGSPARPSTRSARGW